MPASFSENLKDLMKRILVVDPAKRFSVQNIRAHAWYNLVEPQERLGTLIGKSEILVDDVILDKVCKEYQVSTE